MKKTVLWILCAALVLCLCACGASKTASEPAPNLEPLAPVTPDPAIEAASAADAEVLRAEEPPASATDASVDAEALAAAESCVGRSLEELYAAVGEPTGETRYAASCLEENAEDGMLFYDDLGFYVWTVRNADGETVHAVYPLD